MRGRKPKPTHLKLVQGNPGKRALPTDELALPQASIEPPDFLDVLGREAWSIVAPALAEKNLLTQLDRVPLSTWCEAYSQWRRATEALRAHQKDTYTTEGRMGIMHRARPEVGIANEAVRTMIRVGSEFGFSPAARLRLRGVTQGDMFDPFAEFA